MLKDAIKYALRLCFYVALIPIYWIGFLVPRDKRLWVFGYSHGIFVDNGRYLMEYLRDHHPEIRTHWLARTVGEVDYVRNLGHGSSVLLSWAGVATAFRAGVGVETTGHIDLNRAALGGTTTVQLFHGSPLKRMVLDSTFQAWWSGRWYSGIVDMFREQIAPFVGHQYDLVLSASPVSSERLSSAFNVPIEKFVVTGTPRGDVLLAENPKVPPALCRLGFSESDRLILYAPTFRGHRGSHLRRSDIDVGLWDSFLANNDAYLLIKLHHLAGPTTALADVVHARRVKILGPEDCDDINVLLPFVHILATDYSSTMFDFALLGRPIILFAEDLAHYESERGLYENYNDLAEGRYAKDWAAFRSELESCLNGNDEWHRLRTLRIRARYNTYVDTRNCERITAAICSKIGI